MGQQTTPADSAMSEHLSWEYAVASLSETLSTGTASVAPQDQDTL